MRTILAGLVAALLFAPSTCLADTLTFIVTDDGELGVSFGLSPFYLSSPVESDDVNIVDGSVTIVSGPLLSLVVDEANEHTSYLYGAGLLTLEASGFTDDGVFLSGQFVASTEPFQIDVRENADTLFGGGLADDFVIELTGGLFDPALARLLQVRRTSAGGWLGLGLEDIDGEPDDASRLAANHRGATDLEIDTQSVPEPALFMLGLVSAAGWMARTSRTRTRTPVRVRGARPR